MKITSFIKDGKVNRTGVAQSIADGEISASELEELISDPRISAGFIGDRFNDKKPQSEWNKDYLQKLVYTAFAGPFNEDYLRYLYEVSQFVRNVNGNVQIRKIVVGAVIVVLVIVAGIVVFSFVLH